MVFSKSNISFMLACLLAGALTPAMEPAMSMTVEQAVDQALSQNPVMQQRAALEAAAGFDIASARKDLLPKGVTMYSYTGLDQAPVMKQAGNTMQIAHQNQFHWEIALVQPLFTGFARVLGIEQIKLREQYVREETRMAVLDLTRSVKEACYTFLVARKTTSVSRDEVAALRAHAKDAKRFYEQGLIARNDLLKSEVGLAAAVQQAERADADEKIAASMVNSLLNRDAEEAVDLSDIAVTPEHAPAFDPLFESALANRPVLMLLKNTVNQIEVGERLAKSPRYPQVNLVAGYARDGDRPDTAENDHSNTENASISVEVSWTFFQWGKTDADVANARQERQATLHYIRDIENKIRFEVRQALLDLEVARKNISTAETALAQAEENYRITDRQYRQQVVNSSEVLDARAYLTQAEKNRCGSVYGYLSALARLDRAVATPGRPDL